MKINWVLSNNLNLDPAVNLEKLKECGSFWGSWTTWHTYGTDNVICYERQDAQNLLKRHFQTNCNLYIPNSVYAELGRPQGVRLYDGTFGGHETINHENLIAVNLASTVSDIVLLLGFDLVEGKTYEDKTADTFYRSYLGLLNAIMKKNSTVQFVLIDPPLVINTHFTNLSNFTSDTLDNTIKLLAA
jgi:hypothetical protein